MSSIPPRILCLDLGDVVVRIFHTWAEACARAGLPYHEETPEESAARHGARQKLIARHEVNEITDREYFEGLASLSGDRYSADDVARIHDCWLLGEFDGVASLIEEWNRRPGHRTACLSNTNARHWELLSLEALRPGEFPGFRAIQERHASQILRLRKPGAEIYQACARELGAAGGEIVFFDDRPENVVAARAVGWQAHEIRHDGDPAAQIRAVLTTLE